MDEFPWQADRVGLSKEGELLEERHAGVRDRRIVLVGDPAVVAQHLPTLRFDETPRSKLRGIL